MTHALPTMDRNAVSNVLNAAMRIAERDGWLQLRRDTVATEAGVSTGSVSNAYGTFEALRDVVMREAVKRRLDSVIRDGLAARHPDAMAATADVKRAALAGL